MPKSLDDILRKPFHRDLLDKDKISDAVFGQILDALAPPTTLTFDPFKVTASQRIAFLAERSGYKVAASDIRDVFDVLEAEGIAEYRFATVFRRGRQTATSRWGRLRNAISSPAVGGYCGKSDLESAILWAKKGASESTPAKSSPWLRIAEFFVALFAQLVVPAVLGLLYLAYLSIRSLRLELLLTFVGIAVAVTVVVDLLVWGFGMALTAGGDAIDHSHEWRLVTRNGAAGARVHAATMKDLYEHTHGHGSWERRKERIRTACTVVSVLVALACPFLEIPYLGASGVRGVLPIVGYLVVYPLLPLALIGGVAFWATKYLNPTPTGPR